MPLNFAKKPAQAAPAPVAPETPPPATSQKALAAVPSKPMPTGKPGSNVKSISSFMKVGSAAKQLMVEEEAKAEARKADQDKLRRYWISADKGVEKRLTFLDGEMGDDGMLAVPMYHEHEVEIAGDRVRFVCTKAENKEDPCPLCDRGDTNPYLVGLMTVIDHTGYTTTKGKNAGKTFTNVRRLYAAKRDTIAKLTKIAMKRGGLTGCTFDVSRDGDRSANVGSTFEFVDKHETLAAAHAVYGGVLDEYQPANYAEEITFRTPEELIEMGVGKAFVGIGAKTSGALKDHL